MQKKSVFLAVLVSLLSLSFVLAAGSSTNGITVDRATTTATAITEDSTIGRATCEDVSELRDRIKCRLENRATIKEKYSSVDEACRGRTGMINEEKCKALYERLKKEKCYELENGVAKKRCLLVQSGVNINEGGTFRAAPNDVKRSYVVTLLYDLQERIEKLQEQGSITADESADLIAKLVELKQMILDGKARSEVVPKIQEFKKAYRLVISEETQ